MLQIKTIPEKERPREKGIQNGVESLSNRELLAVLIRSGTRQKSALEIADELLVYCHGLKGIEMASIQELATIHGFSLTKALELKAGLELKKRIMEEKTHDKDALNHPQAVIRWLQFHYGLKQQEELVAVYLNGQLEIITSQVIFIGTINQSIFSPREVLKQALQVNASYFLVAHNHPSGNLHPSKDDIVSTRRLYECGKLLNIPLIDHFIITDHGYTSFKEKGIWFQ